MSSRFLLLVFLGLGACNVAEPVAAPSAERFGRPDIVVHAGASIQDALDAAAPGAVIHIEPGTYVEAVAVSKPGIKLVGLRGEAGGVVIQNPGTAEDGVRVTGAGDGFALLNVTIRGFEENGVFLVGVDGFLLSGITAENDGEYGVFPVRSSHGVIERCTASGHSDTGIYVGQSSDVEVRHNVVFANVNGIEIENSSDVKVIANETYDNVAGILVVLLPGLSVKTSTGVLVAGNQVHDNNRPNFAEPGEIEAAVPTGSGILVVGVDRALVEQNTVTGNEFTGIAVGSTLLLGMLAGLPPEAFADIEPNPDAARVRDNVATGNGSAPSIPFLPGVDLLWDGSGVGNCWRGNTFTSSAPDPLPVCT
ncbi:MAG TPA: parallel beta-helix domain-containing protein [Gemmatimonadales bacterium]|jgi:parallel beta-helix repeat protein|nr:parallel beta-helix domain-containing protein [Gemmatimonadales bacterium]